jgi:hypothetical protein
MPHRIFDLVIPKAAGLGDSMSINVSAINIRSISISRVLLLGSSALVSLGGFGEAGPRARRPNGNQDRTADHGHGAEPDRAAASAAAGCSGAAHDHYSGRTAA